MHNLRLSLHNIRNDRNRQSETEQITIARIKAVQRYAIRAERLSLFTVLSMTTRKDGETMNARELISEADRIRRDQSLSQAEWGLQAGFDDAGVTVCRTYTKGNCKLTTLVRLLKPLGYELKIIKTEDLP